MATINDILQTVMGVQQVLLQRRAAELNEQQLANTRFQTLLDAARGIADPLQRESLVDIGVTLIPGIDRNSLKNTIEALSATPEAHRGAAIGRGAQVAKAAGTYDTLASESFAQETTGARTGQLKQEQFRGDMIDLARNLPNIEELMRAGMTRDITGLTPGQYAGDVAASLLPAEQQTRIALVRGGLSPEANAILQAGVQREGQELQANLQAQQLIEQRLSNRAAEALAMEKFFQDERQFNTNVQIERSKIEAASSRVPRTNQLRQIIQSGITTLKTGKNIDPAVDRIQKETLNAAIEELNRITGTKLPLFGDPSNPAGDSFTIGFLRATLGGSLIDFYGRQ
jgi:hypothetical protein